MRLLRHWIEQGSSVDDIARALEDTVAIVEHYEDRLSHRVQENRKAAHAEMVIVQGNLVVQPLWVSAAGDQQL